MALIATVLILAGTGLGPEQRGRRGGPQLHAELGQSKPELAWPDPALV